MTERLHFYFSLSCIGERNGNPLQCSCLENCRDGGALRAASMGSHRVRHDWSDLAAAAGSTLKTSLINFGFTERWEKARFNFMGSQSCKVTPKPSDKRYKEIIMYIILNVTLVLKLSLGAYFINICLQSSIGGAAAAAAKSLQSCPTLCDPMDSSPPGSAVPGILQARTLEWVAISFFFAWKWKVKVKSLSHDRLVATPWTVAHQAPPSMGFSRQEYWSGLPLVKNTPDNSRVAGLIPG